MTSLAAHLSEQESLRASAEQSDFRKLQAREAALREALTELLGACVEDFGPGDDEKDNEPVGSGLKINGAPDPMAITFGMLKRAAAALKVQ